MIKQAVLSKEEAIDILAKRLEEAGYVNASFKEEVIERDTLSSTAFGEFAIPHAMKMRAFKTGMNIMILKEPVNWNGSQVSLIMMMCFNRNERYIFNEVFEPITMILTSKENLKKLLTVQTSNEFIEMLASML